MPKPILNPNLPNVLTLKEVAEYLRLTIMSVRRSESDDTYRHFDKDKNGTRLFRKSDIEAYLQRLNS